MQPQIATSVIQVLTQLFQYTNSLTISILFNFKSTIFHLGWNGNLVWNLHLPSHIFSLLFDLLFKHSDLQIDNILCTSQFTFGAKMLEIKVSWIWNNYYWKICHLIIQRLNVFINFIKLFLDLIYGMKFVQYFTKYY